MKRRMFIIMGSILVLSIVWTGCNMVSDLTKGEKERNLIRLKRGSFRNDGFYSNDFYEFELRMPEAWTGNVDDPPNLLTVNPSSRDVAQSSARKFISIVVKVVPFGTDETLDQAIDRYSSGKNYERILERPSQMQGVESQKVLFYGKTESGEMKIIALFVVRESNLIIIECRALKPLYDNVEAQFGACIDSLVITGLADPNKTSKGLFGSNDPEEDYIEYIVSTTDTQENLAKDFLGTVDRAWMILTVNEIKKLIAGERIRIPRFIAYEMKPEDSLLLIS
ncbi:hypothetical protein K8T06_07765 [bacterium]|nr:hypothetical protein [bacterium]